MPSSSELLVPAETPPLPLSDKDYRKAKGYRCRACYSDRVEAERPEAISGSQVTVPVTCLKCEAAWTELYQLVGTR